MRQSSETASRAEVIYRVDLFDGRVGYAAREAPLAVLLRDRSGLEPATSTA